MIRISAFLESLAVGFKPARERRALSELSDWQLRELGVGRQDLPRNAFDLARQHFAS